MDTFMDKLAERANAQEIIAANMAADTADLSRIQEQNSVYEAMIAGMKESADKNAATADMLSQGAEQALQNAQKVTQSAEKMVEVVAKTAQRTEGVIAAALSKIGEMQASSQNTEELQNLLEEIKKVQAGMSSEISEYVHKENVKVYRNVQAVIQEENTKQSEANSKVLASVKGKVGALLGISIISLLVSAAGLAFQVLQYLGIL